MAPKDRKRAIAIVKDSKKSHERALAYLDEFEALFGTRKFHEKCVKEYETVLAYLKGLK